MVVIHFIEVNTLPTAGDFLYLGIQEGHVGPGRSPNLYKKNLEKS